MKNKLLAVGLLCTALALTACGQKKEEVTAPPTSSAPVEQIEIDDEDGPRSLLTNEEVFPEVASARPLAVMIENTKVALPHYGLANAGIIYEIPAEGGITRYIAFYDDYMEYERLGNVRSTRAYYIYVASEYDAVLAHFGESDEAAGILRTGIIDDINGMKDEYAYFRTNDKKMPHNAYLSSEGIIESMTNKDYDLTVEEDSESHFNFAEEENLLSEGSPAERINLYYYNNKPYFVYDKESQTYLRYAYGDVEPDALSPEGIRVSNIIFQDVNSKVLDSVGHLHIDQVGKGTGKFFTRGQMVDITWEKDSDTGRTAYYMPDGSEIELNTGKTFICFTENSGKEGNSFEPGD